jgi:hypothetical protein
MIPGIVISLIVAFLTLAPSASAADRAAASCSLTDVQKAVSAAVDGDRIIIPPGTCTWTGHLIITRSVELTGSGEMPAIGAATSGGTAINVNSASAPCTICAYESTAGNIVISNLRFVVSATAKIPVYGVIVWTWNQSSPKLGHPVIVHHITMEYHQGTERSVRASTMRGVVYRSMFTNDQQGPPGTIGNTGPTIQCKGDAPWAHNNWAAPSTFGADDTNGDKNLYIETSLFTNHGAVDFDDGCRGVFRYNTLIDATLGDHGHDTSGVGVRHYEVYNNTYDCGPVGHSSLLYGTRGGTGAIYNNLFPFTCGGQTTMLWSPQLQPLRRILHALMTVTGDVAADNRTIPVSTTVGLAAGMGICPYVAGRGCDGTVFGFTRIDAVDDANSRITIAATPASSSRGRTLHVSSCYPGPYPWPRQHGWGWDPTGGHSYPDNVNDTLLEPTYIWGNKASTGGVPGEVASVGYRDVPFSTFPNGPCAWPTFTGTLTSGSAVVTGIKPGTATYFAGLNITGTGIPSSTTVLSVDSATQLRLSAPASISGAQKLTLNNNSLTTGLYVRENREFHLNIAKPGYAPYTYPHPLATVIGGGGGGVPAPSGLRIR